MFTATTKNKPCSFPGMDAVVFEKNWEQCIEKFGNGYTCVQCGKFCNDKSAARNHVEALHLPSAGHNCEVCGKFLKTKYALYTHNSRYHKQ